MKDYLLLYSEKLADLCKSWFECCAYLQKPFRAERYSLESQYLSESKDCARVGWCSPDQLYSVSAQFLHVE